MSEFNMDSLFDDDFTAELRSYFVTSFTGEVEKVFSVVTEANWKANRAEMLDKLPDWIRDAGLNEFQFLGQWLTKFKEILPPMKKFEEYKAVMALLRGYLGEMQKTKKDSEKYLTQFSIDAHAGTTDLYLYCKVDQQEFVIPVDLVTEVISHRSITPFPEHKEGFKGLIAVRGEVVPVFDLQHYGFQSAQHGKALYYIVCEVKGVRFAFDVSETDQLLSLHSRVFQDAARGKNLISAPFIKKFFIRNDSNVMLFDLEQLVS